VLEPNYRVTKLDAKAVVIHMGRSLNPQQDEEKLMTIRGNNYVAFQVYSSWYQ